MTDAFRELCALVKEVGGTMRLHGKPVGDDELLAYAKDSAQRRLDATIERAIARKAEEDAWRAVWMCQHAMTHRGKDIPLDAGGSYQTEVCHECGCFRIRTHPVAGQATIFTDWQPAALYETASIAIIPEVW